MAVGTTAFPTALDTAVELVEAANNASTALNGALNNSDTTITVDSTTLFTTSGLISIDSEIISYTGKSGTTFTGCTRGVDGTSAASHLDNADVEALYTSLHHEALRGAIIAVETKLGYGSSTSTANTVLLGNGAGTSAFGAITNAYIDASAAIAYSKLNLSGAILNADVNASAAIAHSKMAALTASRLMVTDGSGFSSAASVTATEAGYLSGVTSAIQTQLNAKGDASGPASATDNAIARFDGTGGKTIQDSVVTIADTTGNMAGVGTLNTHTIPGGTDTFALLAASQTFTNKVLTAPDINGGTADALTSLGIRSTGSGAFDLTFANTENLAAGRTLTLTLNDADRTVNLGGNLTTAAAFITSGANSLTLTTTGATNVTLPTSGTLAIVGSTLAQFAATTSAELAGVISDETGSGALVFGTSPTLTTPTISGAVSFPDNTRQTFNPGANAAGLNVGSHTADPDTPSDGDLWYATDSNALRARINGATVSLGAGGGGLTVGTTAIASGAAGRILYETSGNVLGEIAGSSATADGAISFTPTARTSGSPALPFARFLSAADTGLGNIEQIAFQFGGDASQATVTRTLTGGGGAIATWRNALFVAPTIAASVAQTITTAATVSITGPPVAGALTTITNRIALMAEGGSAIRSHSTTVDYTQISAAGDFSQLLISAVSGTNFAVLGVGTTLSGFKFLNTSKFGVYAAGNPTDNGGSSTWGMVMHGSTRNVIFGGAMAATQADDKGAQVAIVSGSASRVGLRVDSAASSTVTLNQFLLTADDTNSVAPHSIFSVDSGGTAATGLGGRLQFQLESTTTNQQDAAAIDWIWTDATHASRTAKLTFSLVGNAAALAAVAEFDMSTTAGHTRMLIYDVDNATLERVSVGAADSGGSGFKVLCIPN